MAVCEWSERILVADLQDEPSLSDEIIGLTERISQSDAAPSVVLNFQGVSFVNSSNLAQILDLRTQLQERGGSLRLCRLNQQIWSVMLTTGLDRLFQFESDTATALASLQLEEA